MIDDPAAIWLYATVLAFGLIVGSFLNVVIHRLPRGESIAFPGSHCPACAGSIAPWHNIPVLSYLWLRGRCHHCQVRISIRYPAIELLTGAAFVAIAWQFGPTPAALVYMIFAAGLIVAAAVDFDLQIIPDEISLGGLVFGMAVVPAMHAMQGEPYAPALAASATGAVLGGGTLWLVAFLHARYSVAMGRQFAHWPGEGEAVPGPGDADYWLWFPGLGLGDVKLLAMIGVFLGPWGVLDTILAASLIGLALGVVYGLATRSWNAPFGFGPAISAGAFLSLFLPIHHYVVGLPSGMIG
jgi:leader peptidase (prepilin peptidase)/N-methyltransferase